MAGKMTLKHLDALLAPRSAALAGASPTPGSVGKIIADNLLSGGFAGEISFVNPAHREIAGRKCFASARALPHAPDLAIIATPPDTVPQVIAEFAAAGTKACVVVTAGITGPLRRKCLAAAAGAGVRLLGPNSLGILLPHVALNASFAQLLPEAGDIALLSQSGALVTSLIDWAVARGIGFSHIVSLGDMADVDFGDLLDYLAADRQSRAILVYAEQISSAAKFMSAARRAARVKPVIILKPGRHEGAARAAHSHTGALAGADGVYDAAFRRAGLVRVRELEDLFLAAETLHFAKRPAGDRLCIITNGGGAGVLAADRLEDLGGRLASLAPQSAAALSAAMPGTWSKSNPVDIIGDAGPARYEAAVKIALSDTASDALLIINCPTALSSGEDTACAVIRAVEAHRELGVAAKPVLTCWLGEHSAEAARAAFTAAHIPTYETPEEAIAGFMQLVAYAKGQDQLMETPPALAAGSSVDANAAGKIIAAALRMGRAQLTETEAKDLLACYGIPVAHTISVRTPEGARAAATQILTTSKACVVKIVSEQLTHKSDVGGVRLGLRSPEEAEEAARSMAAEIKRRRPDAILRGFAVEPMIEKPEAIELIAGMSVDKDFGPALLFGAGGVAVEAIKDTAQALAPLNLKLAGELIRETRVYRLLSGYRSRKAADIQAVADVLVRLSSLVVNHPEIRELDINPLLADASGCIALDARVSVADEETQPRVALAVQPYPEKWEQKANIAAIGTVLVRPIKPEDEALYPTFFSKISQDDLRMRFFTASKDRSHEFFASLTQIDYAREIAFVALAPATGELLAVARFAADPDLQDAEFAVLVRSDLKGLGLGWHLMSRLIEYGRACKIKRFSGDVLASNSTMLSMCRALGFAFTEVDDEPTIRRAVLKLTPDAGRPDQRAIRPQDGAPSELVPWVL